MPIDFKESVLRGRDEILRGLVALATADRPKDAAETYRKKAENLLEELQKADNTIEFLRPKPTYPYAKYDNAWQAIMAFLSDRGRSASSQEIIDGVLDGGYNLGKKGQETQVGKAIDAHVAASEGNRKNTGKDNQMGTRIKKVGDQIGLHSWDESYFKR